MDTVAPVKSKDHVFLCSRGSVNSPRLKFIIRRRKEGRKMNYPKKDVKRKTTKARITHEEAKLNLQFKIISLANHGFSLQSMVKGPLKPMYC